MAGNGKAGSGSNAAPTIAASVVTMRELASKAAECDRLERELSGTRNKLILAQTEVAHWRNLCREAGVISERHYHELIKNG